MIQNNCFVFTGGPGAGKTSILEYLRKELGYAVIQETRQANNKRKGVKRSPAKAWTI